MVDSNLITSSEEWGTLLISTVPVSIRIIVIYQISIVTCLLFPLLVLALGSISCITSIEFWLVFFIILGLFFRPYVVVGLQRV